MSQTDLEQAAAVNIFGKNIFDRILANPDSDPLEILVSEIGNRFHCERVYICERKKNGSFDNTYEWCAPGILSELDMLQNDDGAKYDYWYARYRQDDACIVQRTEDLKTEEPELYSLLAMQKIHMVIVDLIRVRGAYSGFIGVDNPAEEEIDEICLCLENLRVLLSEMIYGRDMRNLLRSSGFIDFLTGAGNRMALNDLLMRIPKNSALGFAVADIMSLKGINDTKGHYYGDGLLKQMTEIFIKEFGPNYVFRIGGDEVLGLYLEDREEGLREKILRIRSALAEAGISAAVVYDYENPWTTDFDTLMRRMDLKLYTEKYSQRSTRGTQLAKTDRNYRRVLMAADLIHHRVTWIYHDKSERDREVVDLNTLKQMRLGNIHPEDRNEYRRFWDEALITKRFQENPLDSSHVIYRIKQDGAWVWCEEGMELLEHNSEVFNVLITVSSGNSIRPFHPIHDADIEGARHAKAHLKMYRNADFFHHAAIWMGQTDAEDILMTALDIQNFKLYNSMFGRKAGNQLLEAVQESMLKVSHQYHGISGYMGNDNFALMLPRYKMPIEEIVAQMEREIRAFHVPSLFMPFAGVYVAEDRSELPSEQYEWALLALEAADRDRGEHVHVFSRERFEQRRNEQLLLLDVEAGLRNNEFTFYLQPKVNMRNGRLISFEALVRWIRDGRVISPAVFVEPMEKAGLIHDLDMEVLKQVCMWLKERIDRNLPVIPVSVNLSRADFVSQDIASEVETIVRTYGLDTRLLQVEITESAFNEDNDRIRKDLDYLRDLGHRILLDDFGKGYSTLNSLHSMNLDVLKLDKQFVDALDKEEDRRIVETVIRMAHMIGMLVIAEGVETKEQRDLLMRLNCYYCQGYYFYKPMPKEEAGELINNPEHIQTELPFYSGMRFGSLSFAELIDEKLLTSQQINDIIGPIAIFEVTPESIHMLQMNEAYGEILGINTDDTEGMGAAMTQMDDNERNIRRNFAAAEDQPGFRSRSGFTRTDGTKTMLEATIYPISKTEAANFYLVSLREYPMPKGS